MSQETQTLLGHVDKLYRRIFRLKNEVAHYKRNMQPVIDAKFSLGREKEAALLQVEHLKKDNDSLYREWKGSLDRFEVLQRERNDLQQQIEQHHESAKLFASELESCTAAAKEKIERLKKELRLVNKDNEQLWHLCDKLRQQLRAANGEMGQEVADTYRKQLAAEAQALREERDKLAAELESAKKEIDAAYRVLDEERNESLKEQP